MRIGCEVSDPLQVAYGLPQGSILGPALFNIYINDFPAVPNLCSLKSYVDDSQLYLSLAVQVQPWLWNICPKICNGLLPGVAHTAC